MGKKKEQKPFKLAKKPIKELMKDINKKYGDGAIQRASQSQALILDRIPTGIYATDKLTEGGWPLGRIVQLYGEWSGGKSVTLHKTVANAQRYCYECVKVIPAKKLYVNEPECTCKTPTPWETVWLDTESAYDVRWAQTLGVDTDLVWVIRPEYAEQGLDVLDGCVRESDAGFIVVDTITMLSPREEIEKGMEEGQYDRRARLVNTTLRKLISAQNEGGLAQQRKMVIFLVCQINMSVGMFGGEVKSGGKTKEFANSFELRFKKAKPMTVDIGRMSKLETEVKKTRISSTQGDLAAFNLCTKRTEHFAKGDIDETPMLFNDCKGLEIFFKEKKEWKVHPKSGVTFPAGMTTEDEVKAFLIQNREEYEAIKRFAIDYLFGDA